MSFTNVEILDELRQEYSLSVTSYPDALLNRLILRAVNFISEYYPNKEMSSLETVADQTRYTVNVSDLIKVTKVYYTDLLSSENVFGDPELPSNSPLNNIGSTFAISQGFEFIKRIEMLKTLYPKAGEIVDNKKFDLIPTPIKSGIVIYFEYDKYRVIEDLPDTFKEELIELIFYFLADNQIKSKLATSGGNQYNFERKGNITIDSPQNTQSTFKTHQENKERIIKNIQMKVMKM